MANGTFPAWTKDVLRYGGAAGAVLVVWFTVALPLREDFRSFSEGVDDKLNGINTAVDGVKAEVKNLNDNIISVFRERLVRVEERLETAENEIKLLRLKVDGK